MEQKLKEAAAGLPETTLTFEKIEAAASLGGQARKQGRVPAWVAAAACLVLLLCLGLGGLAVAAEAQEYRAAVAFFDENNLSLEGLTRAEIKRIYRDITTESFTYSKTGEVIRNSFSDAPVGGYEIWQEAPSAEALRNLWNEKNYSGLFVPFVPKIYQFHVEHVPSTTGHGLESKYYFAKFDGETEIWRTYLPFWMGDYCEVEDGLIAYGYDSNHPEVDSWIVKLDFDGNILWKRKLRNGFEKEVANALIVNDDGSYTLFSSGDNSFLCVSRYTPDGQRVLYKQTDFGMLRIGHVARYGQEYLVQIADNWDSSCAQFVRVDQQGNVIDGFSYEDENNHYLIQDMLEWGGKVYISAYVTPKLEADEPTYGGRTEIARILDYLFSRENWEISSEELTPMVRDQYAAVLLVCDPSNQGQVQVFYSIPGSLGGELHIADDACLIWKTESITTTFFSIATSSFTIGGLCRVYQYAFDSDGVLIGCGETEEITNFRR